MTDYHCHILPNIDDGSESAEMSVEMVNIMQEQGVERIIATPHFCAHRERSVEDFLNKRQAAFEQIKGKTAIKDIRLGAEVAIEHGISELEGIEKLAVEGTNIILLELPYRSYEKWMSEEIYDIAAEYKLKVMLAHVHRYLEYYSKEEMEMILSTEAILQINNEAFAAHKEKKLAKQVLSEYELYAFGSDSHNTGVRKPNWELLKKKVKQENIDVSDGIFERYAK